MTNRKRRTTWLLAVAILALALPEVASARGEERRDGGSRARSDHPSQARRHGGSPGRSPHDKYSPRGFERRDHRGHVRYDHGSVRRDRDHVRHDRSYARHDRGHDRHYTHGARHRYPRHGHHVYRLPQHYVTVTLGGHSHYYYHGVWYRPWGFGLGYVVSAAPIGAVVGVLPPFYTTVWVSGAPYYYANYAYYRWSPVHDGYVVVEDPGADAAETGSDELFVYPNAGQSEQQQSDDRYACHRWAVEETGYDPSLVDPADEESALPGLRADYQRAMSACLEGRDYTVK